MRYLTLSNDLPSIRLSGYRRHIFFLHVIVGRQTYKFGGDGDGVIRHQDRKYMCLAPCDRGKEENGRRHGAEKEMCGSEEVVSDAPVSEGEVLLRSSEEFTLEVNEEACHSS